MRRLAAVEPAVIAHDADRAVAKIRDAIDLLGRPTRRSLRVLPCHQQRQLSGVIDAGVDVVLDDAAAGWIEPTLIGLAALSLSLLFPAYFRRPSR